MANMTLDQKIGQLNLEDVGFNAGDPIIDDVLREKILPKLFVSYKNLHK